MNKNNKYNLDYSAECDYTICKYNCYPTVDIKKYNKSTYLMYLNFFDKFDIEFVNNIIKDLFKKYFVWSIDDIIKYIHNIDSNISIESIYSSLISFIDNKTIILDQYERDGYIIQKNNLFIFNPINVNIDSSLYSKILDFSVDLNKYTLKEYVETKYNENLDFDIKKISKTPKKLKQLALTDSDIKFNNKLLKTYKILGTFRTRSTKDNIYGLIDDKFRIIDLRNLEIKEEDDKRKNITGMVITSFNKKKLIDIINYLKISKKDIQKIIGFPHEKININTFDIKQLAKIIQVFLINKKLVLK